MKKYIICFILLCTLIIFGNKASAEVNNYVNLLDMNQTKYNEDTNVFYSEQKIQLYKDNCYTLVASKSFFGNQTTENSDSLINKSLGTKFTTTTGSPLLFKLSLEYVSSGFYYSSITPNQDCYLEFTDFLTKGYDLLTLPKNEIIFYLGEKEEFKGFRENEYLDSYTKVVDTIDIYTGCLNPITVDELTSKLRAYDNTDGVNLSLTLLSDDYKNNNQVGIYEVVYKTIDSSNNESILVVRINVLDTEPPVIEGPSIIEFDCYGDCPSPEEIIRQYSATDEIDGVLSSKIYIQSSGLVMYQIGKTKDYNVVIGVKDKSNNIATKSITLRAKDMYAPELEVKDIEIKLSDLGKSLFADFFFQTIVNVSDNSSTYTLSYESKESLGEFGFKGVYEILVSAKDESGNLTTKKAYITIIDDVAPEFYMHDELLNITTNDLYSIEDIKEAISDSLYNDGILYDNINLISCDYINNESRPGSYTVKYSYSYKGDTNYMIGTINVVEPETPNYYWLLTLLIIPVVGVIIYINKRRQNSY